MAGTQLIGEARANTLFDLAVLEGKPATLFDVFKVVTVNMPVGPGNVMRITKLARMDFCEGALPELKVNVSSYYRLSEEIVEKYVMPEIKDITTRAERPVAMPGERPDIVQARAMPMFDPRGPQR